MSDTQVLSREEVDALLKASQNKTYDIGESAGEGSTELAAPREKFNKHALSNITELTRSEIEKTLSSFFRKKIIVKQKSSNIVPLSSCTNPEDKLIYSGFHLLPQDRYGIVAVDLAFLHQSINLLFGGTNVPGDTVLENSGKIGIIVAEKVIKHCLDGFIQGCKDYGSFTCELNKTTPLLNLITNLPLEEQVYFLELSVFFDEVETVMRMMVAEDFFSELIPPKILEESRHHEKDFWRTAIKSQVVDSIVTVSVTLPDINLKFKDFLELKEGDTLPIGDPTLVYLCLNNLKLFRAVAAQSNSKMVAKIVSQI